MEFITTGFDGLVILKPQVFEDHRGYFFESYNHEKLRNAGLHCGFIQDNQSRSYYGVIRGLHYQLEPFAQAKLIRVPSGRIFDVAVDLRRNSSTFGKWYGLEITGNNKFQLLIPKGFAHGFSVLSEEALVIYKTDNLYNPVSERGIAYDDPDLNIDWKLEPQEIIVSVRDKSLECFRNAEMNFDQ
ncbi:MAG: dTDP-4-dehydrorhamnose 3,5-epimerase [Bacteroidales bacterium]|nr:dTDP-4-dehydrorhamnose 3,5-epimerase [Bacteroidales bacterium]